MDRKKPCKNRARIEIVNATSALLQPVARRVVSPRLNNLLLLLSLPVAPANVKRLKYGKNFAVVVASFEAIPPTVLRLFLSGAIVLRAVDGSLGNSDSLEENRNVFLRFHATFAAISVFVRTPNERSYLYDRPDNTIVLTELVIEVSNRCEEIR